MSLVASRRALLACLCLSLGLATSGATQDPGLKLIGLTGADLRESEIAQGDTIIVFWASWSPKCRDVVERASPIAQTWKGRARVILVSFQERAATVRSFLGDKESAVPVYLDESGSFAKKHGVTTLPTLLVLREGQPLYSGKLPSDAEALLRSTLAGDRRPPVR